MRPIGVSVAVLGAAATFLTGDTSYHALPMTAFASERTQYALGHIRTQAWPPALQRGRQAISQGGPVLWPAAQIGWGMFWMWPHAHYLSWVMETTNGGHTWSIRPTPRIQWEAMTASTSTVNLLGQPMKQAISTQLVWLRTTDGGHCWTRTALHTPGKMSVDDVIDQTTPDPATTVFPRAGFEALGVLTDSGALWWTQTGYQWHTIWPRTNKITAIASDPKGAEAIAGETAQHQPWMEWLQVASRGRVSTSKMVSVPSIIVGMDWSTARDGWVWSSTRLWRTTNGGKTWMAIKTWPGTKDANISPVAWVHMVTSTTGWAATAPFELGDAWQKLWRTTNGGKTWKRVSIPYALTHYRAGHVILPYDGFDIAAQHHPGALTLWMGPDNASFSATPERIWTSDWGRHWYRARVSLRLSGPYD
ncbi:MAG: hypothetical protein M1415_05840 [Firmicutes bacterium]|jgi:hypothetical protein|nr:hypothetical protein [Bacillota bacterium]